MNARILAASALAALGLMACTSETAENAETKVENAVDAAADSNAPKAKQVSFEVTGMT